MSDFWFSEDFTFKTKSLIIAGTSNPQVLAIAPPSRFVLDGHFHADPHPGNLLVQKHTERRRRGAAVVLRAEKDDVFVRRFFSFFFFENVKEHHESTHAKKHVLSYVFVSASVCSINIKKQIKISPVKTP